MIYDTTTKNISFLKMAKHLKDKGVKNNKFMLTLYNEQIQGLNPRDNNLTALQKGMIYEEICANYWYFLREVCYLPAEGSSSGIPFSLHVANMAAAYCSIHNLNFILIMARQCGKTVVATTFSVWVALFSSWNSNETYLHKSQSGSEDNLMRFKKIKELLPQWLLDLISNKNDKDNLGEKYIATRKNRIQALAAATNVSGADKLGRGSSTALVYFDEFAFMEYNETVMDALVPAWSTSSSVAKANNAPYGIRITTTPNTLSLPNARYCYQKIKDAYKFDYSFYDIPENEIETFVKKNSGNDFIYIFYTWVEIGKTEEWYENQKRKTSPLNVKRELDCVWPESIEGNILTETELDSIKANIKQKKFVLPVNGYNINFYEDIDVTLNYIISCDVATGISLDRSVMLIIHPEDFRVVGQFVNSRIDTEEFKRLIHDIAANYLIHSVINIEANSVGISILDSLMKMDDIADRLYRESKERVGERQLSNGHIIREKNNRMIYGTQTTSKSRDLMFDLLLPIVDSHPEVFVTEEFYEELKNLIMTKNQKIEARQGCHDDIVMAYLITRYSLMYGKCFKNKFGISPYPSVTNARTESQSLGMSLVMNNVLNTVHTYENTDFTDTFNSDDIVKNILNTSNRNIDNDNTTYSGSNIFDYLNSF